MKSASRQGMTVLELMIAMAVLVTVMAVALPLLDQMMSRFQMARDHYVAATICQGRLERARTATYTDLDLLTEDNVLVDDFGTPASPGGRFRRTTTVLRDSPVAGLTTITVRADICICSRWGWRKVMHPIKSGSHVCRFTDEHEQMKVYFTEYLR